MTTTQEKVGKFIAENEEKTMVKFMDIAGLKNEYQSTKYIPEIKSVLEKFTTRGYTITRRTSNNIDLPMILCITLLLNDDEVTHQDIEVRFIK